jgi:hypothetical protein
MKRKHKNGICEISHIKVEELNFSEEHLSRALAGILDWFDLDLGYVREQFQWRGRRVRHYFDVADAVPRALAPRGMPAAFRAANAVGLTFAAFPRVLAAAGD